MYGVNRRPRFKKLQSTEVPHASQHLYRDGKWRVHSTVHTKIANFADTEWAQGKLLLVGKAYLVSILLSSQVVSTVSSRMSPFCCYEHSSST